MTLRKNAITRFFICVRVVLCVVCLFVSVGEPASVSVCFTFSFFFVSLPKPYLITEVRVPFFLLPLFPPLLLHYDHQLHAQAYLSQCSLFHFKVPN